jgi:hypothetical protein
MEKKLDDRIVHHGRRVLLGCGDGTAYTLYRSSPVMENARLNIATFNAADGAAYNNKNCLSARDLYQQQPGVKTTFWCEKGRFRPSQTDLKNRRT